jgi:hypothetical protein
MQPTIDYKRKYLNYKKKYYELLEKEKTNVITISFDIFSFIEIIVFLFIFFI